MDYKFLLESMLKYLDEGVLVVDCDANITFFNEPATNIAGIDLERAIGKNILEIFSDLTPETSTFYYVLKTRKPLIEHVQTYTNYKNKKVTTVTSTIPLIENGKLIGALEIYRSVDLVKKLSDKIIADLCHNLGIDPGDDESYKIISEMDPDEVIERFLTWNGIIGRKLESWCT